VAFLLRGLEKAGVHLGVLVGLALDGHLQAALGGHLGFRVQQVEVTQRVHHFLCGGLFKNFCDFLVSLGASNGGEIAVLGVSHRLAGKSCFEIGMGLDVRSLHGVLLGWLISGALPTDAM
jgi:hypothetical protein